MIYLGTLGNQPSIMSCRRDVIPLTDTRMYCIHQYLACNSNGKLDTGTRKKVCWNASLGKFLLAAGHKTENGRVRRL